MTSYLSLRSSLPREFLAPTSSYWVIMSGRGMEWRLKPLLLGNKQLLPNHFLTLDLHLLICELRAIEMVSRVLPFRLEFPFCVPHREEVEL